MNNYYLTLLVKNDLDEKVRNELLDSVTKSFDKLEKQDLWGSRSLSYPIKHQNKAFYAHYEFSCEPQKIAPLDKMVKLNEDVLRYILLRKD
jgi:small subunit ribosomal protein S6